MTLSAAELPAPLPMSIPKAGTKFAIQSGTQIEKLMLKKTVLSPVTMPVPFGKSYALAFWVNLDDTPMLMEKGFTQDAPVTLADWYSDDINSQRTTLRIQGGKFVVTALNDGKWKALPGIGMKTEPGKWYFLAYSYENGSGAFYVNGDIILRTPEGSPAQDALRNIAFGHFQKGRRLEGIILQPRLYPAALNAGEIKTLFDAKPTEVR
jgi:hypothetical protein